MSWYEELPDNCPPEDSCSPDEIEYFRLVKSNPPTDDDFVSHRKLQPDKEFNYPECLCRAVSLFTSRNSIENLLKLRPHRNKKIAVVPLKEEDGVLKQTGQGEHHMSWWRSSSFNISHCSVEG